MYIYIWTKWSQLKLKYNKLSIYTNIQNATIKFMCKHSTQTGDCLNNHRSMWKNINIFWNTWKVTNLCRMLAHYIVLGLGRATFFMVRAGFRAWGFGSGRARATGNVHGLITTLMRELSNNFWAFFHFSSKHD